MFLLTSTTKRKCMLYKFIPVCFSKTYISLLKQICNCHFLWLEEKKSILWLIAMLTVKLLLDFHSVTLATKILCLLTVIASDSGGGGCQLNSTREAVCATIFFCLLSFTGDESAAKIGDVIPCLTYLVYVWKLTVWLGKSASFMQCVWQQGNI